MKARIKIEGLKDLTQALAKLDREEIPRATRNALNDIARDVQQREEQEIARVFHRPVRIIQRPFYVERAEKTNLVAELRLKDVFGEIGNVVPNTLEPHIPGHDRRRQPKGMERALRRKKLISANEYLVPSRTMRLNAAGNVPGSVASKMLNDLWTFSDVAGFKSSTGDAKRKYLFGEVRPKGRKAIKGIWDTRKFQAGRPGALMMLVVTGAPTYAKRFRYYEIAERHVAKVTPKHAQMALEHALRRSKLK